MENYPTMQSEEREGALPLQTKLSKSKEASFTRACASGEVPASRARVPSRHRPKLEQATGPGEGGAESEHRCPASQSEQRGLLTTEGGSWAGL